MFTIPMRGNESAKLLQQLRADGGSAGVYDPHEG